MATGGAGIRNITGEKYHDQGNKCTSIMKHEMINI